MSDTLFRQLALDDLPRVAPVRRRALATLADEGEAPERPRPDVAPELVHIVRTDPDLAWIAEEDGRPLGYALGTVRDRLCTVSHLFVDPELHERDIGGGLLERLLRAADARGATRRWVVASSSVPAHALYLRHGMYDRALLYPLRGPLAALLTQPEPRSPLRLERPTACPEWLERMTELDRAVRGAGRPEDHEFFLGLPDSGCRALLDGQRMLGYVYFWQMGHIGPLAAAETSLALPLLRVAADRLRRMRVDSVTFHVPSCNETVLDFAMERRFVIRRINSLMTSGLWGRLDRYLPSGGVLM